MIFAVRHCESEGNTNRHIYLDKPNWEIGLTEKGKEQAQELSNKLQSYTGNTHKPLMINTSPFERARQTAELACGNWGLSIFESPLLSEREWGTEWRQQIKKNGFRKGDFDFYAKPFGAESFAELYVRVKLFLTQLDPNHHHILFTHGEWIKVALMISEKWTVKEFDKKNKDLKIGNGEIIIL